ncbi:MAG: AMP-binding protein [Nostoc sp. ChiSLP01]|nr:AMP-binding protein [Nostoc sp. CmiSLP01]MDZ8282948.1 AMP-binding protein [Nostoc sp. ChiSLP01]
MEKNYFAVLTRNEATLVDLLGKRALQQPNQVGYTFLVDGETKEISLTYQELDQKARSLAAKLQSIKATKQRALLLYPPGLDFIIAFFGCLYAGVTAVPVYPPRRNQRMTRLQSIVTDAQASFALTTTSVFSSIQQRLTEESELASLHWLTTDDIPTNLDLDWQKPQINQNTLAFLQYTSGSTGKPKGVMVNHGNLLHNLEYIKQAFELTPDSVSVTWLPSFHDMGLIDGIFQPLYAGFLGVLMSPVSFLQQPIRWLEAISRYRATHCGAPNFAYDLCDRQITPEQLSFLDLSSWSSAYSGAEPIRRETLKRLAAKFEPCGFRANFFYPCYGLAEATLMVSGGSVKDEPIYCTVQTDALTKNQVVEVSEPGQSAVELVSCGRAWMDTKIVIVNPESMTTCAANEVGEIWVSSPSVTDGYWKRPQETQQTFHAQLQDTKAGPFLRTGDLGFLLNGELFVTGRLKDIIIIRGQNHYPQDIEFTVHKSHVALRPNCGAAFSVEVEGIERLVIVQEVERTYLRRLDVNEVAKAISQAVFQQHQLQVYAVVLLKTASIPKTSSGKIQRHACRNHFLDGSLDVVGQWTANFPQVDLLQLQQEVENLWQKVQNSPESKTEQKSIKPALTQEAIATWLISHLALSLKVSIDRIDIYEPFATYGLDSALAVSMTGELSKWVGCELDPTVFWEYPNIEMLAQYLAAEYLLLQSATSPVISNIDERQIQISSYS